MWSIWLCGRCAGQVRPRTARRQPGSSALAGQPQKLQSPDDDRGSPGCGQLLREPAELQRRTVGEAGREVHADEVDRVPVDVEPEVQDPALAHRVARGRAHRGVADDGRGRRVRIDTPKVPSPSGSAWGQRRRIVAGASTRS